MDPSEGCFGCHKTAFSDQKRFFLEAKKADQQLCENWRVSLIQNSTNIPECASEVTGENWRKQLRDCITQSLQQNHLGSGTFARIFWSNGPLSQTKYTNSSPTKRSLWATREELLSHKRGVCGRGVCERGVCVFVRVYERNSERMYKIERESNRESVHDRKRESTHAYALSLKEREQPRECTR